METRKKFLTKCTAVAAALTLPRSSSICTKNSNDPLKTQDPKKALVLWYSQTGNTKRYGLLIAKIWEKLGLKVTASGYREINPASLPEYDIIMIGTPVYYYDTPDNVKDWLKKIPCINGTPIYSFVSFGGPEGNQHNAACTLLELLADKGGIPVGMSHFMNMSSAPFPEWDGPGTLEHRHLPNEDTFEKVRYFAKQCLIDLKSGKRFEIDRHIAIREFYSSLPLIGMSKLYFGDHYIEKSECTNCGTCEKVCPSGAISPSFPEVKTEKCILCFGCINNCPEQAVKMSAGGQELYNFSEFLKRNKIVIKEPVELST